MRKRLSRFKGAFAVLLLLPLCVLACGGSTEADTAAPKSPYELENMITENDADIASILADIGVIRAQIESIAVTNYSTAISEILARLAILEAHFVPTPTPTGAGGSPVPTVPPSGGMVYLTPSAKFYESYQSELKVCPTTDLTTPTFIVKFESDTEVASPSPSFDLYIGGSSYSGSLSTYVSASKTVLRYTVNTSVFIPAGATSTGTVNFSCGSAFWTPSVTLE